MKIRMSISNVARYYLMLDAVSLFCHLFVSVLCHYSVCISLFPLSVNERYTCLWKCTPCNLLFFLTVCAHNLTPKLNTLCAPALRHYAHTPISNHVMTLTHPPLGDVKHQEEVSQGRHLPGVFILFYLFFSWADGMSEASSGSGSPQSITSPVNRRSWERHLVTSVCASWWKIASEGTHTSDFCGLTNLILPKKKGT